MLRISRGYTILLLDREVSNAFSTFKAVGAPAELPQLFIVLAHKGVDAGLSDKALTALVEILGNDWGKAVELPHTPHPSH